MQWKTTEFIKTGYRWERKIVPGGVQFGVVRSREEKGLSAHCVPMSYKNCIRGCLSNSGDDLVLDVIY